MKRGQPSQCHRNSLSLWEANKEVLRVATGYALSKDGMWRQHSWCVWIRPRVNLIVETTKKRIGYFGFVLTNEEAINFAGEQW